MEVVDSIGKITIISLLKLEYNQPLEKKLFVLPRVKVRKRN
jgi:hypothetical protein